MAEYVFDNQVNIGWGLSLDMTGKAPAIANRIFKTYDDANEFATNGGTCVPGLILRVIKDETESKNGAYLVREGSGGLYLSKLTEGELDISGRMIEIVLATDGKFYDKKDCTESESKYTPKSGAVAIVDENVTAPGKYLLLSLGSDVVYINSKDLIDMDDYYTKNEVDEKINNLDSSIDDLRNDVSLQRSDYDEFVRLVNAGFDEVISE